MTEKETRMYESLLPFAQTDRQREVLESLAKTESMRKTSIALGCCRGSVQDIVRAVRRHAAIKGHAPEHDMTHVVADPYIVKGTSTLYNDEGKPVQQWVKTSLAHDRLLEIMANAVDELKRDVVPIRSVPMKTRSHNRDLLNLYTLSDAHIGMLAWREEGGADWDLSIAERTILDAISHLIAHSPDAAHGVFAQLGDGLHSDGLVPVTPTHGHVLDQDGRFHKVVRSAIRIFRTAITMLLQKHRTVTVLMAQGNHDLASSVWLQEMFAVLFEKNKRVQVVVSPKPYYAIEHGDVMLGFHHGHKTKPESLPDVFMGEFREMFGRTRQTYIHCGHMHGIKVLERNSAVIEQHGTLAARDAHASHGGYKSGRQMSVVTYHRKRLKMAEFVYQI